MWAAWLSPFEAASFDVTLDEGCGMGFSAVHKVRAAACKALEEAILAPYEERAKTLELPVLDKCTRAMPEHYRDEPQICACRPHTRSRRGGSLPEGATRHLHDHRCARCCRTLPCRCI